ncbi:MAG: AAA family ATPase [Desulfobulbaceae bacterium]|nr:AAA family ATPase [Desulfobulbaceae bacterium]
MPPRASERPRVVVFFGLVASGKSHLAKRWARVHHCRYYNTDIVRKELFGLDPISRQQAEVNHGIYSAEHNRATYREMIRRMTDDLDRQRTTIALDGSYREEHEREKVVAACGARCDIVFIYCYCSETETRKRLDRRAVDPTAVSDGRWEIYLHQRAHFRVPTTIEGVRLLLLNTEDETDRLITAVDRFVESDAAVGQGEGLLSQNSTPTDHSLLK